MQLLNKDRPLTEDTGRAINSLNGRAVTLEHIPDDLAMLSNGRRFLQEQGPEVHVYYSEETIEMACCTGLYAIVADGVHTKQPKELQLYCVHGVCDGGVEVPLLYAMAAHKTEDVYTKIFGHLKDLFEKYRPRPVQRLRIVLDFEKASIAAARRLFPEAKNSSKLNKFIQGHVQGCVPPLGHRQNSGGDRVVGHNKRSGFPPQATLPRGSSAVEPSSSGGPRRLRGMQGIPGIHATWFDGPYKDMWNKWEIVDIRTTNIAEAFHNRLNITFGRDHPDLRTLLEKLKYIDFEAKCTLRWMREHPRRKASQEADRERRENIERSMKRFGDIYRSRGVTTAEIEDYCKYMARYVSGKTI
ncbi:hypothetical protein COOONC_21927 [Cooperia oncophora]